MECPSELDSLLAQLGINRRWAVGQVGHLPTYQVAVRFLELVAEAD